MHPALPEQPRDDGEWLSADDVGRYEQGSPLSRWALARYLVAESLPAEAAEDDPRGYALSVARSEGWPGWLRVLLARPPAYSAALGRGVPREPLAELARNPDPAVSLWADAALALSGDEPSAKAVRDAATSGPDRERGLARHLVAALDARNLADRVAALDAATLWLRDHLPDAAEVWRGWVVRNGRVEPADATAAPRPGP